MQNFAKCRKISQLWKLYKIPVMLGSHGRFEDILEDFLISNINNVATLILVCKASESIMIGNEHSKFGFRQKVFRLKC